ncbi:MAG: hypothetical protein FWD54_01305 [Endomicrobia bacterium]|nr:hypothetical protein [Endomicrobiia bacterium]MCL2798911.1 hypothetical protein [Endomicrobiia bacterium]
MKLRNVFLIAILISFSALFSCASIKVNKKDGKFVLKDEDKPFKVSIEDKKTIDNCAEITEIK